MSDMTDTEQGAPLIQPEQARSVHEEEQWWRSAARKLYSAIANCGLGILFGALTAIGLKTVGTSIAIALVLVFVGINVLAYYGFVNFNWQTLGRTVSQSIRARLDLNADREFGLQDVSMTCKRVSIWCMSWGLPSLCSFALGFWLGWRVL